MIPLISGDLDSESTVINHVPFKRSLSCRAVRIVFPDTGALYFPASFSRTFHTKVPADPRGPLLNIIAFGLTPSKLIVYVKDIVLSSYVPFSIPLASESLFASLLSILAVTEYDRSGAFNLASRVDTSSFMQDDIIAANKKNTPCKTRTFFNSFKPFNSEILLFAHIILLNLTI